MRKGRFGPYVQHGKTVANLPRGVAMEEISLDDAVKLLAEKGKALKPRGAAGRKGKAGAKTAAAEAAAKSPARKESTFLAKPILVENDQFEAGCVVASKGDRIAMVRGDTIYVAGVSRKRIRTPSISTVRAGR